MKNKKLKIIISLIVCVIFTACGKSQNSNKNTYEYKTKYVGDNSKVMNILSNLKYPKETSYNSVQILSEKEPYGVLVKLNINSGKIPEKNEFLKNSAVLFALIENLFGIGLFKEQCLPSKEILDLINNRQQARQQKDYKTADEIREKIEQTGYSVKDRTNRPIWQYLK